MSSNKCELRLDNEVIHTIYFPRVPVVNELIGIDYKEKYVVADVIFICMTEKNYKKHTHTTLVVRKI